MPPPAAVADAMPCGTKLPPSEDSKPSPAEDSKPPPAADKKPNPTVVNLDDSCPPPRADICFVCEDSNGDNNGLHMYRKDVRSFKESRMMTDSAVHYALKSVIGNVKETKTHYYISSLAFAQMDTTLLSDELYSSEKEKKMECLERISNHVVGRNILSKQYIIFGVNQPDFHYSTIVACNPFVVCNRSVEHPEKGCILALCSWPSAKGGHRSPNNRYIQMVRDFLNY